MPSQKLECTRRQETYSCFHRWRLEGGRAGLGAVAVDTVSDLSPVWAGTVPEALLEKWRHQVGEQLI